MLDESDWPDLGEVIDVRFVDGTWREYLVVEVRRFDRMAGVIPGTQPPGSAPTRVWWVDLDRPSTWRRLGHTTDVVESKHNASCPRCGSPAYEGFLEIECSRSCAAETTPRHRARPKDEPEQKTIPF